MALRIVVLVLFLQCYTFSQIILNTKPYTIWTSTGLPDFCKKTQCPQFTVVTSNATLYETRQYGPERWVANDIYNRPLNFDTKKALFVPLFQYSKSKRFVTSPLLLKGYLDQSNRYTMMFYVPKYYTTNLYNRGSVYISEKQNFTAYVRSFAGNPNSNPTWNNEANILKEALIQDNKPFNNASFYSAIYGIPWSTYTQHNEIWFIATSE